MSPGHRTLALSLAICCGGAAGAAAHVRLRAVVSLDPAQPVSGDPCRIEVRFETTTGEPVTLAGASLVAEMSGHAMRPVEAQLEPTGTPGAYRGELVFTMAGPWRLALQADDGHGAAVAVADLPVEVADAAAPEPSLPAPPAAPIAVELSAPPIEGGASPWAILLVALGLTVAAEAFAVARKLSRQRSLGSH